MTHKDLPRLQIPLPEFVVADADGWVHFRGLRVGLSSVVRAYQDGYSPEMLAWEYPALSLATIHKTIVLYLENRDVVNRYLEECSAQMTPNDENASTAPSLDELRKRFLERALAK